VTLVLQLAHDRFDEGMAHMDGVRLILKVFQSLEPVQTLTIETVAHNGKLLHRYRAARVKAQPYFEKLDDPFQRRRMRDWWPYLTESAP
jgi:hypothetical protein